MLLTLNQDILDLWKEYFEDHFNPTNTPSGEEAELGKGLSFIAGAPPQFSFLLCFYFMFTLNISDLGCLK